MDMVRIHQAAVVVGDSVLLDVEGRPGDRYAPALTIEEARLMRAQLKKVHEDGGDGGIKGSVRIDVPTIDGKRYTPVLPAAVAELVRGELNRLHEAGELGGD